MKIFSFIHKNRIGFLSLFCILELFYGVEASAQTYVPLAGIPGVTDTGQRTLSDYINALFILSISVGAMIGVVKIALGGFKYMMSEVITNKSDALQDIKGALIGLGILISTFVVLSTINPELVNISNMFEGAKRLTYQPSAPEPEDPTISCENWPESPQCQQKKCAEAHEGGQWTLSPVGRWYCKYEVEDVPVNEEWVIKDSGIVNYFQSSKCADGSCKIIFVADSDGPADEQGAACTKQEGTFTSYAIYDGQTYRYCSKKV